MSLPEHPREVPDMPPADTVLSAPRALPPAYFPVTLFPDHKSLPLRLAVVARQEPDPVAGHFVVLRNLLDAVVYLGCITDASNRLHGYVEIWVQTADGLANSPAAAREALSNKALDDRWVKLFKSFDTLDEGPASTLYRTGFETVHPRPFYYDSEKREMIHTPAPFSAGTPALCTDDALLTAKGLPPYSTSLHRYLYVPGDDKAPFVPITPDAPTNSSTVGVKSAHRPFNPGGLMLIRAYAPANLEAFFDLLAGATWEGILTGRSAVHLDGLNTALEEKTDGNGSPTMADGRLFLGKHGKWGRLIETFHLKLRLVADCLSAVRSLTAATQRPFLNLTANSFQVQIGAAGAGNAVGLPFLWTANADLVDPGDAVVLKMEASEAQYFLRGLSAPANVYQPESVSKPASGTGTLRIRKTLAEAAGLILEATLSTTARLGDAAGPGRNDLVWLRAPVGSRRLDLYGHVEKEPALAAGEWRFRTERQKLSDEIVAQLKAAEGVPIGETLFDVIPLLSSPCDLYSLAILGARALLVNHDTTLAIVADELLSLARQVALEHRADIPLPERIRSIFQNDQRWLNALGPHRLTRTRSAEEELTPQQAFDLVPADLWFDALGLLIRMIPGLGPDSICRDYGDAPRGGLHKVYDPALSYIETLLVRTRSLIVIDWRFNREIHAVLRQFSTAVPAH